MCTGAIGRWLAVGGLGLWLVLAAAVVRAEPRVIDDFENVNAWEVRAADGVSMRISSEPGVKGGAMRIDYDFSRGSGYGIVRRELNVALPENYRFAWEMRGQGPRNTLEFKLVDKGDENVWWVNQVNFAFPEAWTQTSLPRRRFSFAWGPSGGKAIDTARFIEIAITSYNGGKGTVWLDELAIEELAPVRPYAGTPRGSEERQAVPVSPAGEMEWEPAGGAGASSLTIDYGDVRGFGAVLLKWAEGRSPRGFVLEAGDGKTFEPLAVVEQGGGTVQVLSTPDRQARAIRLRVTEAGNAGRAVHLRRLDVLPPEAADDPNAALMRLAKESPVGRWPRALLGQGTYWTVMGADRDYREALIGEDGEIELDKSSPSLQPFIVSDGELLSWHNAKATRQDLLGGWLPMPGVTREYDGLALDVRSFVDGKAGESVLWARYTVRNTSESRRSGKLAVALRPVQVNPPYQQLNMIGGVAPVRSISGDAGGAVADGRAVRALTPGGEFGARAQAAGDVVERFSAGSGGGVGAASVEDASGLASAAWVYPFDLGPGETMSVVFASPMTPGREAPAAAMDAAGASAAFDSALERTREWWTERLSRVRLELPGEMGRAMVDSVRANLAYILINKDGAGIQPGSRSYERTWIRDGTLTSAALLSFGITDEVREFLDWFGPFQYDNGKVPCCVDRRGPDPVPEHDSHGQYIHAVMRYYRHTGDTAFLRRHWPRVVKAAEYIQALRAQRSTPAYKQGPGGRTAYYGLVPESISHEGYSAKPMHSYWDNLFCVLGLREAAAMARALGELEQQVWLAGAALDYERCLVESYRLAMRDKGIDYLPGCVELGDFDATSTTVAMFPCDLGHALPQPQLNNTFERFWAFFQRRRDGVEAWRDYTPYEHRIVGAMIELGWRERAHELWRWYFQHQRPAGWRHWAEVVWKDERAPRFIGDMPHSWCGSDFVNSARLMLAFEHWADQTLVLGAGLPLEWLLDPGGVWVEGLQTFHGAVSYSARGAATSPGVVTLTIEPVASPPEGGVMLALPEVGKVRRLTVDGEVVDAVSGRVRLPQTGRAVRVVAEYEVER